MFSKPRFGSVVLDVDSTVSGIEGIDWLAALRGPEIATRVARMTRKAMDASTPLEEVYGERLQTVAPTRGDIDALGRAYVQAIAPGAAESIAALKKSGVRVTLVSGGIREAILPLAEFLHVDPRNLHAVGVQFSGDKYAGFDRGSALATSKGKRVVVEHLKMPAPILGVGDGATDVEMKPAVDQFGVFTGFVRRESVAAVADVEFPSFAAITQYVLG
jgi:Haloacid Dehalogenase superfamily, subfamily IB, phosphoserine phosphatase-like